MPKTIDRSVVTWRGRFEALLESQLLLGALVAVLTVATAYVAFRSTAASLDSSTLDFYAGKEMQQAALLHLSGNANYMVDLTAFNGYSLLEDRDPDLAEESLSRASEDLLTAMERPGGPFDEEYKQARYGEARAALDRAQALYDQADRASMQAEQLALASAILSIGLGATAWAALLQRRPLLRMIFAVLAIASLLAALTRAFLYTGP
jgi:hypothetical protein